MWDQLLTKLSELWNTLIDALQKGNRTCTTILTGLVS